MRGTAFQIAGHIHHQHRAGITEMIHHVGPQVVTHRVGNELGLEY